MDILDYGDESVSVAIEDVPAGQWAEQVHRPDIFNISGAGLCKKPGHAM